VPVVSGQLHRPETEAVEIAHDGGVAVEIEAPFYIENRGDFARRMNSFDFGRIVGDSIVPEFAWICVMQASIKRSACLVSKRRG
jgi:hypothetical protein